MVMDNYWRVKKPRQKRGRYGDGCVYKNGRLWWLSWYEATRAADGSITRTRKFQSSGTDDKKLAQKILRSKLQLIGGRRPTVVDPQKVSYQDLREIYLNHCELNNRRSLKKDKEGKPMLATFPRLDKYFSGWQAHEIDLAALKRFRVDGKAEGLSDARLNRYMATLRAAFRQAIKDDVITSAEAPAYFPTVAEPNEARGAIYVEDGWYEPLKKRLNEPLRSAFVMAYHSGIRVHEMLRLKWQDVDLKARIATLPAASTKTGHSRLVPLHADVKLKPGKPDEVVFPLGNYRWQWYKACVAVKAGRWENNGKGRKHYVGLLLRHCRHTFVRNASDAGLEEKRIMDITGHKTRATFDRYNIGRKEDVQHASSVLELAHKKRQQRL
jgi:integrase